jgi:capsular exopolysaccharide synthesis family protein
VPDVVRERRALVDPAAASSDPFRTLRLALQLRAESRSGNVILFTSPEAGVGKSTVASNYALVSALSHSSVLLVDGDLRAPTVHECFGVPRSPGLVDALAVGSGLEQFARRVAAAGQLDVLPAGSPIPRAGDLPASARMGELLREASARYDAVVIDSPPLLAVADAEGFASHPGVDVVLVVGPATRRRAVQKAVRKLELIEAHLAGTVVNRVGRQTGYAHY